MVPQLPGCRQFMFDTYNLPIAMSDFGFTAKYNVYS
jgi:hypothetical protein